MLRAGYCTACGTLCWRTAVAQKDHDGTKAGEVFLLWPKPDSCYAKVETETGYAPGVAYCARCAPPVGGVCAEQVLFQRPILGYEKALERYSAWYTPEKEEFYRAWLHDHLYLEPAAIETLMIQWHHDQGASHA